MVARFGVTSEVFNCSIIPIHLKISHSGYWELVGLVICCIFQIRRDKILEYWFAIVIFFKGYLLSKQEEKNCEKNNGKKTFWVVGAWRKWKLSLLCKNSNDSILYIWCGLIPAHTNIAKQRDTTSANNLVLKVTSCATLVSPGRQSLVFTCFLYC